jgi:serine/threonine protein kinase
MALAAGTRPGSYEILAPLGAGGMGEVYRATDTKLGREVAIKVLPSEVAQDAGRLARFQREATLLAALNHPHIAAIHGLEEDGQSPSWSWSWSMISATTIGYLQPEGYHAAEVNAQFPMPAACTATNLYVETRASQPATGTMVFTIRDDGAPTSVTITMAAEEAAGLKSDRSNTASVAAGSIVSVKVANNASTNSASIRGWSFQCN